MAWQRPTGPWCVYVLKSCKSISGLGDGAVTGVDFDVSVVCAGAVSESSQLLGRKLLQTVTLTCPWCVQVL